MNLIDLIDLKELLSMLKISRSAVYLKIKQGLWPKAIKISSRTSRWFRHEAEEMIRVMASGADPDQIKQKVKQIHESRNLDSSFP